MKPRIIEKISRGSEEFAHLQLEEMGPLGDTLAHYNGKEINVSGGIPGEEVICKIIRSRGNRNTCEQISATVTKVLRSSPHRIKPPCPYFGPCSGCQWQHINYKYQLSLKRETVRHWIRKFKELGNVPVPATVASPQQFGYRNHARLTVRQGGKLGFNNRATRKFVQINHCMLMNPGINKTLQNLQGRCSETTNLTIRHSTNTSEYLIQPSLKGAGVPMATGQTHYKENLSGNFFRVASPSFFQVNTEQTEWLAILIRNRLKLTGTEMVIDAYAGVGTFAVLLSPYAKKVVGIEESLSAVRDSTFNSGNIDNVEFQLGKTEDVLSNIDSQPDAIVLDPPRTGCEVNALKAVIELNPLKMTYVSCVPETLCRDLRILVQGGLQLEIVEPVDMFPQTHHIECVATLSARE